MKFAVWRVVAVFGIAAAATASVPPGYELVWAEEFEHPGRPDPVSWGYEQGFIRNREEQFYRPENAWVENGVLVIEARRERILNPRFDSAASTNDWRRARRWAEYTSASVTTRGKRWWRYGRIEVRAELPQGRGVWPAIWLLGTNITSVGWPRCGEIDIMEFVGKDPHNVYATVHFADGKGTHRSSGNGGFPVMHLSDCFHVYVMEWTPQRIDFFVDDKRCFSFEVDLAGKGECNPFRQPFFLILNLAVGGTWGGAADESVFPQRMLIDYVRVYRKVEKAPEGKGDSGIRE